MNQLSCVPIKYNPSFCGRNLVIREAQSYIEKIKVNKKMDESLTAEFYDIYQPFLSKFVRLITEKIENFFNFITLSFADIKKQDVIVVYDEQEKLIGGFIAKKVMNQYKICGLFIEKEFRRTQDSMKALSLMFKKIKDNATKKKLPIISCDAYKDAISTIRLYKKVGFKDVTKRRVLSNNSITIEMEAKTSEFGQGVALDKYR